MVRKCINCQAEVNGKYCSNCGQSLTTRRISLSTLIHEIVHTFTHLDKGYGYTLRELIIHPGQVQRQYLEGHRYRYQKPFSYFFINATVFALVAYWISVVVADLYGVVNVQEGSFFRHYFALTQVVLLPFYALTSWVVWKLVLRSAYNYGEMLVLVLYSAGTFMLFISLIVLTKLIWPDTNTRYIEVLLLVPYNIITNYNFFNRKKLIYILMGTVLTFGVNYLVSNFAASVMMRVLD